MDEIDIPETLPTDIALRHVYQRGTCCIHLPSDLMKPPPEGRGHLPPPQRPRWD